jgi:hypothetical protein
MIEIIIDPSYVEDYFMISEVSIKINDASEKHRIEKLVEKHNIVGSLVDGDRALALRIVDILEVPVSIIDIDTNEIDLM